MITNYAKYTVNLSTLLANTETKTAIENALSTYPLYEAKKTIDLIPTREELNERLLNHYKYREIGFETVGRFLDELKITMHEIMPYYNEMFKTVETMDGLDNIFDNVDVVTTFEETRTQSTTMEGQTEEGKTTGVEGSSTTNNTGTTTAESEKTANTNSSNESTRKFSDTPQNRVDSLNNWLTEYTENSEEAENKVTENSTDNGTSTSKQTSEGESTTTESGNTSTTGTTEETSTTHHTFTKKGNQGVNTYAHDMLEYRTLVRDIVDDIINDNRVNSLFMLVW